MSKKYPIGVRPAHVPEGFPGRVDFVKSAANLTQAPHSALPEICFCGRSNVGKSSLLNVLCNRRQLARVSSTPGRTRLINFFTVQDRVTFVDLPGYGWAKAPTAMVREWGKTIQDYLTDRRQLAMTLLLVDIRRDPKDEERDLLAWFQNEGRSCLVVATKVDKVPPSKRKARINSIAKGLGLPATDILPFSALDKSGREAIWGTILGSVEEAAVEAPAEAAVEAPAEAAVEAPAEAAVEAPETAAADDTSA
ncbi:MAG: GTP-binding protein [Myxococcota bacterium]|jgi:GTP-binding protein